MIKRTTQLIFESHDIEPHLTRSGRVAPQTGQPYLRFSTSPGAPSGELTVSASNKTVSHGGVTRTDLEEWQAVISEILRNW